MLFKRSANFIKITLTSSAIAKNILRKFSACCSSRVLKEILLNLVTPLTNIAISSPNSSSMEDNEVSVSSIMSCKIPAAIVITSSSKLANILATSKRCEV
ncbi:hypothetical protein ES705_36860 [subsurface metagenome]